MDRRTFLRYTGASVPILFLPSFMHTPLMQNENLLDVVIVGGSYAGLSAAMALGRARRNTVVVDAGEPCNRFTPASHNFLTQDGVAPAAIAVAAKAQVERYPTVSFRQGLAHAVQVEGEGFRVELADGNVLRARRVLLATGIRDQLPEVPGVADCWGKSVIHCPYCHGYEYADQPTAMLLQGPIAMHLGAMLPQWTSELHLLGADNAGLDAEQRSKLGQLGIRLHGADLAECIHVGGALEAVRLSDGTRLPVRALYIRPAFEVLPGGLAALAPALTEHGHVQADVMQRTSVPGLYAAGDLTSPMRSVANAVAQGNMAGAAINGELAQAGIYTKRI